MYTHNAGKNVKQHEVEMFKLTKKLSRSKKYARAMPTSYLKGQNMKEISLKTSTNIYSWNIMFSIS